MLTEQQRAKRSEAQQKYYNNPENRHKDLARGAVADALRRGKLQRLPCAQCGSLNAQAHHHDYSKPLDVNWLCPNCHGLKHRKAHCSHGHALVDENLYHRADGKRCCRACRKISADKSNAKSRASRCGWHLNSRGQNEPWVLD